MEKGDVAFQILLSFFVDPFLEVDEVEGVRVFDVLVLEPFDEEREVVRDFLAVEDPVDHMAAEKPHLDLVPSVEVDLTVLVDCLENVRSSRPVRKFQLIKGLLIHNRLIPLLEVLDGHVMEDEIDF